MLVSLSSKSLKRYLNLPISFENGVQIGSCCYCCKVLQILIYVLTKSKDSENELMTVNVLAMSGAISSDTSGSEFNSKHS